MDKIITLEQTSSINRLSKKVILVGGFFDILHIGHLKFLAAAKKAGGLLIVSLESDENAKKLKGKNRPLHSQNERAEILAGLNLVDYVVLLPPLQTDADYFDLVKKIRPNFIAVTENDPIMEKKRRQAEMVCGKLIVVPKTNTPSTTQLAKLLEID
ncbi:adenylyltransferase/cytidyltransferase family protein [Candidatus Gottesmanbacteria bacterium]|nr:adenylyltransferase/cytidyltransferase family protein [Candidatus Gottesmanbacteria bacterium]